MATKSVGTIRALMEMASRKYVSDTAKGEKANNRFNRGAQRGFRKSNKSAGLFTGGMKRMLGAAVVLAGPAALGLLIKNTLATADTLAKTADKVGFGTDALQELRFAAKQSGVEFGATDIALQRFSRRVGEASQGQGVLFKTLKDNNIQLRNQDNTLRTSEEILGDYADLIGRTDDQQQKLLLTFQAFDTEGAALVNLLGEGSGEMNKLRKEARDLGLVLDENLLRGAEDAGDALNIMGSVLKTQLTRQVLELAPAITKLATAFIDGLPGMVGFAKELAKTIGLIDDTDQIEEATKDIGGFVLEVANVATELDVARDSLKGLQDEQAADPFFADWQELLPTEEMETLSENISTLEGDLKAANLALSEGRKRLAEYKKEAGESVEQNEGLAQSQKAVLDLTNAEIVALKNGTITLDGNTAAWIRQQEQMAIMALKAFPDISNAMAETEARMSALRGNTVDDMMEIITTGEVLSGALQVAFSGEEMRGTAFKRFMINVLSAIEAVILASGEMSKALAAAFLPGIGTAVAVGALIILESAKAGVRALKFAEGGSMIVRGGGGTDAQQFRVRATEGEKLTIQTPAQQAAGIFPGSGGMGGGGTNIEMNLALHFDGITPEEDLRKRVVPGLEQMARDGATDLISLKNIADGSNLGGDLNRQGKGS